VPRPSIAVLLRPFRRRRHLKHCQHKQGSQGPRHSPFSPRKVPGSPYGSGTLHLPVRVRCKGAGRLVSLLQSAFLSTHMSCILCTHHASCLRYKAPTRGRSTVQTDPQSCPLQPPLALATVLPRTTGAVCAPRMCSSSSHCPALSLPALQLLQARHEHARGRTLCTSTRAPEHSLLKSQARPD